MKLFKPVCLGIPKSERSQRMLKVASVCALLTLIIVFPACKGGSTAPEPPSVTVTSITVTSLSTMLKVGQTETFTATANMSNGTTQAATGTWSSNNSGVATVNAAGLVNIMGSGNATITMSYSGKTGSKNIRGLPDYQGTYISGTYTIASCSCSGDFTGACDELPNGTVMPIEMNLMQTTDMVSGTIFLGSLTATMSGQIAADGELVMTGQITGTDPFIITVVLDLNSIAPGQLTGGLSQNWTAPGYSGSMLLAGILSPLARSLSIANEAGLAVRPLIKNPTLEDLKRALRTR